MASFVFGGRRKDTNKAYPKPSPKAPINLSGTGMFDTGTQNARPFVEGKLVVNQKPATIKDKLLSSTKTKYQSTEFGKSKIGKALGTRISRKLPSRFTIGTVANETWDEDKRLKEFEKIQLQEELNIIKQRTDISDSLKKLQEQTLLANMKLPAGQQIPIPTIEKTELEKKKEEKGLLPKFEDRRAEDKDKFFTSKENSGRTGVVSMGSEPLKIVTTTQSKRTPFEGSVSKKTGALPQTKGTGALPKGTSPTTSPEIIAEQRKQAEIAKQLTKLESEVEKSDESLEKINKEVSITKKIIAKVRKRGSKKTQEQKEAEAELAKQERARKQQESDDKAVNKAREDMLKRQQNEQDKLDREIKRQEDVDRFELQKVIDEANSTSSSDDFVESAYTTESINDAGEVSVF